MESLGPLSAGNDDCQDARELEEAKAKLSQPTKWLIEQQTLLQFLTQLKVLSRKETNRKALGQKAIAQLLKHLSDHSVDTKILAEGANVVLNVCYERDNVRALLACGGASTLVEFLTSKDEELQANAAGALQSICFQPEGRTVVRSLGAIPPLVDLLSSGSLNVRARAVGALHNISSDEDSIRVIRRRGGIRWLVRLLHHTQPCVCGSAAGALQNVSREVASRLLIRDSDAINSLIKLLQSTEVQTQVCAAGALLNVLGPELCDEGNPTPQGLKRREAFVKTITLILVASIIKQTVFTKQTRNIIASATKNSIAPVITKSSSPTWPKMTPYPLGGISPSRTQTAPSIPSYSRFRGDDHSQVPKPPLNTDWSLGLIPPGRRALFLDENKNARADKQSMD
nr:vacuolar protein 8-like [Physcomitrium patens]|eukprot:XP_024377802.1 vacuolar protein 8-like [Physcomitrella patens]